MNPKWRVRFAWGLMVLSAIAWPFTSVTVFRDEPQGVLALSWLAIMLTGLDILSTQDVRKNQDDDDDDV